jgi:hypothetical protein
VEVIMVKRPAWQRTWVTDLEDLKAKQEAAAKAAEPKQHGNPNWKPGRSPNPGGRPRGYFSKELGHLCRLRAEQEVEIVNRIIKNPKTPPAVKLQAIQMKWDRGWGRPSQTVVLEQKDIAAMSDAELYAAIRTGQRQEKAEQKTIDVTPNEVTINRAGNTESVVA